MAATRTAKIFGRIWRDLKYRGLSNDDFTPQEIYEEMQSAQTEIFSRVLPEREYQITLVDGQSDYPLGIDTANPSNPKSNISSIKEIITPKSWSYDFEIVKNDSWNNIINDATFREVVFGQTIYAVNVVNQPVRGTILNNILKVFPVPDANFAGDVLTLYCYLSDSDTEISKTTDPELPSQFDKAIEFFAVAQFLTGSNAAEYLQLFELQMRDKLPLLHRKQHNLQRERNW